MKRDGWDYGGDDVNVARDERRRDVCDGEIGDAQHDEIIERIV